MLRKQDCLSPDFSKLLKFLKLLARFSAAAAGPCICLLHIETGILLLVCSVGEYMHLKCTQLAQLQQLATKQKVLI